MWQGTFDKFKTLKWMQSYCMYHCKAGWIAKHLYSSWYLNIYRDAWLSLKWNNFLDSPLHLSIVKIIKKNSSQALNVIL